MTIGQDKYMMCATTPSSSANDLRPAMGLTQRGRVPGFDRPAARDAQRKRRPRLLKEIHRERAEFVKAIQKMSKPQTINGLFEERELMIDGGNAGQSLAHRP